MALAEGVLPAEALELDIGTLGLEADILAGIGGAVGLAEGVAAGDQRDRLFVVHRHAGESIADIARRGERVGIAVRAFGVHVDEAHLHGRERIGEVAIAAVTLSRQPLALGAPIDVLAWLPGIDAAAGEAEGPEAHRFQGDVAGQDQKVGPGDLAAVFLLDRPEQAPRLVEVDVVRPGVQRGEALLARPRAAAAVLYPVGAGAVPGHPCG